MISSICTRIRLEEQQTAFEIVKTKLTQSTILTCPDFSKKFILQTDASDVGLGTLLTQQMDEEEGVVAYDSQNLIGAEKNYTATKKECLALIFDVRKTGPYLQGYNLKNRTDRLSQKWLNSMDIPAD